MLKNKNLRDCELLNKYKMEVMKMGAEFYCNKPMACDKQMYESLKKEVLKRMSDE